MSTKKIFTVVIIILLIANMVLLGFFMMNRQDQNKGSKKSNQNESPKTLIIKRLDFNESQKEQFLNMVTLHREKILLLDERITNDKRQLFSLLSEPTPNIKAADSLTSGIASLQKQIETLHFNHFQEVKAMCNENQVPKFNDLSKDIVDIFNAKRNRRMRSKIK